MFVLLSACASQPSLPTAAPIPGGLAVIEIPLLADADQWLHKNRPVWTLPKSEADSSEPTTRLALVGIPLNTKPGSLSLISSTGKRITFQVQPHQYQESRIYVENQAHVNPPKDTLVRIRRESREIRAQFQVFSKRQPKLPFTLPVSGTTSSSFGLRRFFNDQPRKPHSGLDIAAPTGTAVRAPTTGTILMTNHYYFNGKTVFLDHGQGLVSMYCHLDQINVVPKQQVKKGALIGRVGSTGRSTGAHLHWSVNLGGAMVNPLLFVGTPKAKPQTSPQSR